MKPILPLLLCCLILIGCGSTVAASDSAIQSEVPAATAGLYDPGHRLETETLGAVHVFSLQDASTLRFYPMGTDILLVQEDAVGITVNTYVGDILAPGSTDSLVLPKSEWESVFHADSTGFYWYDEPNRSIVYTDNELRECQRIPLPDSICCAPCLTADNSKLFYSTDSSVCEMDLSTGICRVLKQTNARYRMLTLLAEDTVLYCQYPQANGMTDAAFLSVENGSAQRSTDEFPIVCSYQDTFYALRYIQQLQEILIQKSGKDPEVLVAGQGRNFLRFFPERSMILTYRPDSTGTQITVDAFDANTGTRTATLRLPHVSVPIQAEMDAEGTIWFLTYDEAAEQDILLRWNPETSSLRDARIYLGPHYTRETPDLAGLYRCAEKAEEISQRHGIRVLTYEDAAAVQPWDYHLTPEYLVPQLNWELDKLDSLLDAYPEGFLQTLSEEFDSVSICLVRSIEGTAQSGTLNTADGLQFWDGKNGYIALAVGTATQYNLYHELSHLIDTHVINRCRGYDNWEDLNPANFAYDYDYTKNLSRDGSPFLGEEDRAFVDTYSMSFPAEDRARIMEFAMNDNNDYLFQSPIMQAKLKRLCLAIRDAFGLTKVETAFRWEQYLEYSLAYREWKK